MDVWVEVDFPVLKATVEISIKRSGSVTSDEVAEATGMEFDAVVASLERLGQRYLNIRDASGLGGRDCYVAGVTAKGLEVSGAWPNPEALQERFVAALEEALDSAPVGSPKANKIEGVLESIRDLSTGTGANLFGQIIFKMIEGAA